MGVEEFTDMVRRTRVFLFNLVDSVAFLMFGGLFTGYWLVVGSLQVDWWGWLVAALGAFALGVLGGVVLECYLPWPRLASASMPSNTGLRWLTSLVSPFAVMIVLYAAGTGTWLEEYFSVLWYPFLGVALVLAGLLIERPTAALNPGLMRAKPFLATGLATLLLSPLALAAVEVLGGDRAWTVALGLMILSYTVAGIHTLHRALSAFEE